MTIRREMMILLAASGLLVGSCASKEAPVQVVQSSVPAQTAQVEKTTTSVKAVEDDMRKLSSQINKTNATLNEVILARGTPAAKGSFDAFTASVTELEKIALPFFKDSDQMTARGTDYFDEWKVTGSTYINPQIQSLSEQKRAALSNTFRQIANTSSGVKEKAISYLSDVNQIRTYLTNDLSPAGIDAMSPVAQKAIGNGQQILAQMQPILATMAQARAEISTGAAAGGTSSPGM